MFRRIILGAKAEARNLETKKGHLLLLVRHLHSSQVPLRMARDILDAVREDIALFEQALAM